VNPVILGFIRKELLQARREPKMLAMIFFAPIFQMTMFAYALSTEMRNIRLALVAPAGDTVMVRLHERALSSGWFVEGSAGLVDPVSALKSGRAEVVVIAPPGGLTRAVARGEGRVQVLVDATNAVRARTIEFYLQRILAEVLAGMGDGTSPPAGVSMDLRVLYNPSMRSSLFMVPAIVVFVLGIDAAFLLGLALAREKETGTMETLLSAPVAPWEILLGKIIPNMGIMTVSAPLVLTAAVLWFEVPVRGPLWEVVVGAIFFMVCMSSIGIMISTLARNQQQAMMGTFMFMLPAVMLSGIMFPVENMPAAISWITWLNPLKYFANLLRNVMLKGGDPFVVWSSIGALALLSVAVAGVAVRRFRQTLN
jgi:ABC-2 type transport system permease protein